MATQGRTVPGAKAGRFKPWAGLHNPFGIGGGGQAEKAGEKQKSEGGEVGTMGPGDCVQWRAWGWPGGFGDKSQVVNLDAWTCDFGRPSHKPHCLNPGQEAAQLAFTRCHSGAEAAESEPLGTRIATRGSAGL